jgi:hypothetical protein
MTMRWEDLAMCGLLILGCNSAVYSDAQVVALLTDARTRNAATGL